MKLSSLFLPFLAAGLVVTSCSDDDNKNKPEGPDDAVRFNVTVPKAVRRDATTTQSIRQFTAWSFVGGNEYMPGVSVNRDGSSWTATPTMYWPGDGQPVNFFCISPMVGTSTTTSTATPHITGYTNTLGTTDLLYAVTMGATRNPVSINFRHALAKVGVRIRRAAATPQQAPIKVEVSEVAFTDIATKGDFTYPMESTSQDSNIKGTWQNQSAPAIAYLQQNETEVLEDEYDDFDGTDYEFAIPQSLAASQADYSGAYVRVQCAIYDERSNVRIWPVGAQTKDYLYFPLNNPAGQTAATEWESGKAYLYSITIGVPESSSKIDFSITVDEYPSFENADFD